MKSSDAKDSPLQICKNCITKTIDAVLLELKTECAGRDRESKRARAAPFPRPNRRRALSLSLSPHPSAALILPTRAALLCQCTRLQRTCTLSAEHLCAQSQSIPIRHASRESGISSAHRGEHTLPARSEPRDAHEKIIQRVRVRRAASEGIIAHVFVPAAREALSQPAGDVTIAPSSRTPLAFPRLPRATGAGTRRPVAVLYSSERKVQ